MRVFRTLVWREIFERRLLLLTSALLGLIPLILPWLPVVPKRLLAQDIRTVTVWALTGLFGGAAALILGSTIVGRDAGEGRLGFYFSRPISSRCLWSSRVAAAVVLLLLTIILLMAPTLIVDLDSWVETFSNRSGERSWPLLAANEGITRKLLNTFPDMPPFPVRAGFAFLAMTLLVVGTHAVSTVIRGRSLWVLADLAGLGVVLATGWAARNIMVREEALAALVWVEWLLLPWMLGCGLWAGANQLEHGRTDTQSGHRWLSATLWSTLLVGALGFLAYATFVANSDVEDLEDLTFTRSSPNDEWLVVGGPARHRVRSEAAFLIDTRSLRSWRLGSLGKVRPGLAFSADSSTVSWVRCQNSMRLDCTLWRKNLLDAASPPEPTEVPIGGAPIQMVLSRDGQRIALAEARRVAVYQVPSGNLVGAVEANYPNELSFLSADRLRFHEHTESQGTNTLMSRIRQVDLGTRQVDDRGLVPFGTRILLGPSSERMLYLRASPDGFELFDSDSGDLLAEFQERFIPARGQFLADGGLVLALYERPNLILLTLSSDGRELHRSEHLLAHSVRFGGELSAGQVVIALHEPSSSKPESQWPGLAPYFGWSTYVLDTETGTMRSLAVGGVPLGSPRGASAPRLFLAGGKAVLRWNPETDEQQVLVPPFELSRLREGVVPWKSISPFFLDLQ